MASAIFVACAGLNTVIAVNPAADSASPSKNRNSHCVVVIAVIQHGGSSRLAGSELIQFGVRVAHLRGRTPDALGQA